MEVILCWQPENFYSRSSGSKFIDIKLHQQAATTPKIRTEIQAAPASISDSELARQYGVDDSPLAVPR